jgi:hypothetical protein
VAERRSAMHILCTFAEVQAGENQPKRHNLSDKNYAL